MIRLQYFNGEFWDDCGEFISEAYAWESLAGDDENYRTFDMIANKVITDKCMKDPIFSQLSEIFRD